MMMIAQLCFARFVAIEKVQQDPVNEEPSVAMSRDAARRSARATWDQQDTALVIQ